ncbi:MAG: ABC transporter substrate-binding protein [Rhizobiaceae bacterium]
MRHNLLLAVSIAALALSAPAGAKDLSSLVPADIKEKGYIEVVTDPSFGPPWNYHPGTDQTVYEGIDPDIAKGISERLGVEIRFVSLAWTGIIPAVRAGRYDMVMVGMSTTEERTKVIDLVDYAIDSNAILVQIGNPLGIKSPQDLCGKKASAVIGSLQFAILQEISAACDKPITISTFPTKSDSFLQVETKRADATIDGKIVSGYLSSNGIFASKGIEVVFTKDLPGKPLGIGLAKEKTALRDAVAAAIDDMIADGTYTKIFAKWGTVDMPLQKAEINNFQLGKK